MCAADRYSCTTRTTPTTAIGHFLRSPTSDGAGSVTGSGSYQWRASRVESEDRSFLSLVQQENCMDAIRARGLFDRVKKARRVEKRRRLFKSREWDLDEPDAFASSAR